MNTVILEVRSLADAQADAARAMEWGKAMAWHASGSPRPNSKPCAAPAPSPSEMPARRVGRDVKAVHGDVTALLSAGVLNRSPEGRVEFPFDSIKVGFMLRAA